MSEFFEGGNHTDQTEVPEQQEVQTEVIPETPVDSEYDVIKYNKEDKQLPVSERQRYLQQGYHYEQKVKGEMEVLRQQAEQLERVAKFAGYNDHAEFLEAIQEQERQLEIQQEAERLGISSEQYEQYLQPVNNELSQVKSELETLRQQENMRAIDAQVTSLQNKYDDFSQYEEQVFQLAIDKSYDLEDAYILVSHADRLEKARVEAQQHAVQSLQNKQLTSPGSLSGGDGGVKSSVSALSKTDFATLKEKVLRGETKQL